MRSTYQFVNSALVFSLAFPLVSFADMPADAPGKLNNPILWDRCLPGGEAIPPADCQTSVQKALTDGCVGEVEANYAIAHSLQLGCNGKFLFSACVCGCFEANTRILGWSEQEMPKWTKVSEIKRDSKISSLDRNSTLSNVTYAEKKASFSTSGQEISPLYVFDTTAGKLSVTQNHAVLLADGRLVAAKDVKPSDALVSTNGSTAAIVSIERKVTTLPVYNFQVANVKSNKEHLVAAEGLIVGDLYLQNSISQLKNSILARK